MVASLSRRTRSWLSIRLSLPFFLSSLMAVKQQPIVLSFEAARRVVQEHASSLEPRGRELLGLLDACGRVLAEPIHADRDFPPFPRATRDGYAVCAVDVANTPAIL